MAGEVVRYTAGDSEIELRPEFVRSYLVTGTGRVTDAEVVRFMYLCAHLGADPFRREAYLIKYSDNEEATIVVGIGYITKKAAAHPMCRGWNAGVIVQERDGGGRLELEGSEFNRDRYQLVGGWSRVYRRGWAVPLHITVSLREVAGRRKDGSLNRTWAKQPGIMIRKTALMQGLREAFPDQFSGVYGFDEMGYEEPDITEGDVVVADWGQGAEQEPEVPAPDMEPSERETVEAMMEALGYNKAKREATLARFRDRGYDELLAHLNTEIDQAAASEEAEEALPEAFEGEAVEEEIVEDIEPPGGQRGGQQEPIF